jgi:hypothetical protein
MSGSREPHEPASPGPEENWNESLYLWWREPVLGLAGTHRIAHTPNEGRAQLWTGIVHRDGSSLRRCTDELELCNDWRRGGNWQAEGLHLSFVDGGFEIAYDSPDGEVQLSFSDLHQPTPLIPASGTVSKAEISSMLGSGHVSAGGTVTGTVRLGDDKYALGGALGFRDHSWGPRRLMDVRSTRWITGTVGPELSFSAATGVTAGGGVHRAGYVVREGEVSPLLDVDIVLHTEIDGLCWRRAEAVLTPAGGPPVHAALDDVVGGMVFRSKEFLAFEAPSRLTVDGAVGVGNCQTSNNPFGGVTMPAMATRATVADGFTTRPD